MNMDTNRVRIKDESIVELGIKPLKRSAILAS